MLYKLLLCESKQVGYAILASSPPVRSVALGWRGKTKLKAEGWKSIALGQHVGCIGVCCDCSKSKPDCTVSV